MQFSRSPPVPVGLCYDAPRSPLGAAIASGVLLSVFLVYALRLFGRVWPYSLNPLNSLVLIVSVLVTSCV